ncbi:aspartate/glutamate racemase family protein [Martelella alba]|uniref:Aspartate/glutamate racemase family protein n=1 Tax=Martelella alba TaxID=2590451 RepID=A0ABY2SIY6_9HYPH|nr:amino acid racemase [Martelella alba]TKI04801.1 aspartate/glutamate racemase family protein [Martelella alba]
MGGFLLGILGGMGPLATVDLLQKIIEETPASRDQLHAPVVVWNVPQVPDRQLALAGAGPSPLAQLQLGLAQLNRMDVSRVLIPCNTAHYWYPQLAQASRAPILHIADAATEELRRQTVNRVGLIATQGTLDATLFQPRFAELGIETLIPRAAEMKEWFVPGCYAVKRGDLRQGGEGFARLADALAKRGAERLVLACSEVPPALAAMRSPWLAISIDPTRALAKAAVRYWLAYRDRDAEKTVI